jgi:transcriptional regulator with XRE-family HTH domain
MEKTTGHPETPRLLVVFLRFHARKSQVGFGRAAGLTQSDLSRYESGQKIPSEEVLQRMAAAGGVSWSVVIHLRRFYDALLSAISRHPVLEEDDEDLDFGGLALLAVRSYLMEDAAAETAASPGAGFREKGERGNIP